MADRTNDRFLFEKMIGMAAVLLTTVPICRDNKYDMEDMSWMLMDPVFVMRMMAVVVKHVDGTKSQSDRVIEEAIRIFMANMFNHSSVHVTISGALFRSETIAKALGKPVGGKNHGHKK